MQTRCVGLRQDAPGPVIRHEDVCLDDDGGRDDQGVRRSQAGDGSDAGRLAGDVVAHLDQADLREMAEEALRIRITCQAAWSSRATARSL